MHLSIIVPDEQTNYSTIACIVGTCQMFGQANTFIKQAKGEALFEIALVGASTKSNLSTDGFEIKHQRTIADINKTDLIIIPASTIRNYQTATPHNKMLIDWIGQQYKYGAEVASMCVGSFMLASTGILAGKACSTHWAYSDVFRQMYPEVHLKADKIITHEKGIYTNGGAYSFLHLNIYLIEKYYGRAAAIHCAKYYQIDIDRAQQAEFTIFNGLKNHRDEDILKAQKYLEENYKEKISIEKLSADIHLGRRNFDRRFIKATGLTPVDYLQRVKVEQAKVQFESTRKTVNEVMYDVGYSDPKAFRDVFARITGMSPLEYKTKYSKS